MECKTIKKANILLQAINNIQIILQPERNNTCGVLFGSISKELDKIVEFSAFESFISFERKSKNKVERVENHKIKVTIEVDMVC